ncbi:hypothetical protein [Paraburkholderia gardini]|uniref:hypothetical protein n=1 Tax=Paraburkholderia gardini TaxID=2823469 RepID=UPI001E63C9A8|nr:hypothetical protein [Paraburkholderia gardini]
MMFSLKEEGVKTLLSSAPDLPCDGFDADVRFLRTGLASQASETFLPGKPCRCAARIAGGTMVNDWRHALRANGTGRRAVKKIPGRCRFAGRPPVVEKEAQRLSWPPYTNPRKEPQP